MHSGGSVHSKAPRLRVYELEILWCGLNPVAPKDRGRSPWVQAAGAPVEAVYTELSHREEKTERKKSREEKGSYTCCHVYVTAFTCLHKHSDNL